MHSDGDTVIGKSTDEKQLIVKGSPLFSLTAYVEVIDIADSNPSIHAEVWNNFGDTFGMISILYLSTLLSLVIVPKRVGLRMPLI